MSKRVLLYFILVIFFTLYNFYLRPISGNPAFDKEFIKSDKYVNELYRSDEFFKERIVSKECYPVYDMIVDVHKNGKREGSVSTTDNCVSSVIAAQTALYLDHPELLSYFGYGDDILDYSGGILKYKTIFNTIPFQYKWGAKRIAREMENIRNDVKGMDDREKIIYVYDYVASHNYDKVFMNNWSNQSAYNFFLTGSTVCAGFAKASQMIFQNIGINAYLVLGSQHMWNYVEYKGEWYIFDATYGASFRDKTSKKYYDGLGNTTVGVIYGDYQDAYPKINETHLRDIFGI